MNYKTGLITSTEDWLQELVLLDGLLQLNKNFSIFAGISNNFNKTAFACKYSTIHHLQLFDTVYSECSIFHHCWDWCGVWVCICIYVVCPETGLILSRLLDPWSPLEHAHQTLARTSPAHTSTPLISREVPVREAGVSGDQCIISDQRRVTRTWAVRPEQSEVSARRTVLMMRWVMLVVMMMTVRLQGSRLHVWQGLVH